MPYDLSWNWWLPARQWQYPNNPEDRGIMQPARAGNPDIPARCACPCEMHHTYTTDLETVPNTGVCRTPNGMAVQPKAPESLTGGLGDFYDTFMDGTICSWIWPTSIPGDACYWGVNCMCQMFLFADGHAEMSVFRLGVPIVECWTASCERFNCTAENVFTRYAGIDTEPTTCIVYQTPE